MTPSAFVHMLAEFSLPAVFNPYSDKCAEYDRADAAKLRRRNLQIFLEAALEARTDTFWIARDLGYRGGRRTGIPLTDEIHLSVVSRLLGGIELRRATRGPAVAERTAAVVWRMLSEIGRPVVLWNVFPFHPHEPDDPLSNRCHTANERLVARPLLQGLLEMFQPRFLVAIGRDAQRALLELEMQIVTVRHPSYGGQADFIRQVSEAYSLRIAENEPMLPLDA